VDLLRDPDQQVRHEAALGLASSGPQPGAPLPALLEALRHPEAPVRAWACGSLAEVGPAASETAPLLLAALQDAEASVRSLAAYALGRLGPRVAPALAQSLQHVDPRVRAGVARALGIIGTGAQHTLPALQAALRDEHADVALAAATAVARIAETLQLAEDPSALAALEPLAHAVAALPQDHPARQPVLAKVHAAIHALQTMERARSLAYWLQRPWIPWLAGLALYVAGCASVWLALLWLRPLAILHANQALARLPLFRLPGPLNGVEFSLRGLVLARWFQAHPRVLDAWVEQHAEAVRAHLLTRRIMADRSVHVAAPVLLDGAAIDQLTPCLVRPIFERRRSCLLISGEGGAGKTALACQLARWALADAPGERLTPHRMLPVVIDEELGRASETGPTHAPLLDAIRGQLQACCADSAVLSQEFLESLLRSRRVVAIVDRLSEIGSAGRDRIRPGQPDFPVHALIVTSRLEETLDGVPRSVLQPSPLAGTGIARFLDEYLEQREQRSRFTAADVFEACRHLSEFAGPVGIPLLLAKLYAEQLIRQRTSDVPATDIDLFVAYLNELNRSVGRESRRADFEVQRDIETLAWECVRPTLAVAPLSVEAALSALGGAEAASRLAYLQDTLQVLRATEPARDQLVYRLDALAETFAALHVVNRSRADASSWRAILDQATHSASQGFLRAVRDCCLARGLKGDASALDALVRRAASKWF
jgi:hypothetical protein